MRSYLWLLLASVTGVLAALVTVNVCIDPYGIFGSPRIMGVNAIKARAGQREQLVKRHMVYSVRPKSIILGNSRAEVGFDPLHPAWPLNAMPVLNLAIPGAGLRSVSELFQHAMFAGQIQLVVLGLDFVDFRLNASSFPGSQKVATVSPLTPFMQFRDYVAVSLSLDALVDSILTVSAQYDPYPTSLTALGFNPMLDYVEIARKEGYGTLFAQRNQENAKNYLRGGKEIVFAKSGTSAEFEATKEIVERARANGADIHLVIYPYHADILLLFDLCGLWDAFEDWKRELVKLVDSEVKNGQGAKVYLWDFSGFNEFTTERVPEVGDTHHVVRWYWEAGHFKKELGDMVLSRILGAAQPVEGKPSEFGVLLSKRNVEGHLASMRGAKEAYRRSYPEDVARLIQLVQRLQARESERLTLTNDWLAATR